MRWRRFRGVDVDGAFHRARHSSNDDRKPQTIETDPGSQFTSLVFTQVLADAEIPISMDGQGGRMDNVFNELLWRSLKYERVYPHAFETGLVLHAGRLR